MYSPFRRAPLSATDKKVFLLGYVNCKVLVSETIFALLKSENLF
jgi:hypothetical protein